MPEAVRNALNERGLMAWAFTVMHVWRRMAALHTEKSHFT